MNHRHRYELATRKPAITPILGSLALNAFIGFIACYIAFQLWRTTNYFAVLLPLCIAIFCVIEVSGNITDLRTTLRKRKAYGKPFERL